MYGLSLFLISVLKQWLDVCHSRRTRKPAVFVRIFRVDAGEPSASGSGLSFADAARFADPLRRRVMAGMSPTHRETTSVRLGGAAGVARVSVILTTITITTSGRGRIGVG
jgi:hypothetical protein